MRYLFLLFFGYLIYNFLIKPVFLGAPQHRKRHRSPQEDMLEMMRRMQQKQATANNSKKAKATDEGEYIDYEEIE